MHLPWNRKYVEIIFHVVVTVLIFMVMIGIVFRLSDAKNVISETARGFLAVFSPLIWALFFSLILEPLVSAAQEIYEKHCSVYHLSRIKNRRAGTLLAFLISGLFLFLFSGFLAGKIGDMDVQGIIFQITDYIRRVGDILVLLNLELAEMGVLSNVEGLLELWTEQVTMGIESRMLIFANTLPNIGGSLLDVFIGVVLSFYFLMEKQQMLSVMGEFTTVLLGKHWAGYIRKSFYAVYSVFSGYFSGQGIDAVIMAVLFSVAFLIVGLPNAVFLGIISGFFNLIPYFGAVTAFILAVFSGLLSGTPMKAIYASVLILLLQQVDSMYIVPKVVGKRVELHPVMVILSLVVFGKWFGFWGVFLAVPLGALCKNFLLWLYERKKRKECL